MITFTSIASKYYYKIELETSPLHTEILVSDHLLEMSGKFKSRTTYGSGFRHVVFMDSQVPGNSNNVSFFHLKSPAQESMYSSVLPWPARR